MAVEQVLIAGCWRDAVAVSVFGARNPSTGEKLPGDFPVSAWADCEAALSAASKAQRLLRNAAPEQISSLLEGYADRIEARSAEIVAIAHMETGLPASPRLKDIELPRTTTQLRQAAAAARDRSWTQPVLDTRANIRSHFAPIGLVVVFGPNNFPFAFNAVSGGDFAAAIAAGCPVIAKAHPSHPRTSKLLAECALEALAATDLPLATVQMLYALGNEDGLRLVSDPRVAATSFTGSRSAGLRLKAAADAVGKLMYLEMSSLNPVVLLPGAIAERPEKLVTEVADSCLAASGQFCTSPNLILVLAGEATEHFVQGLAATLGGRPVAPLLSEAVLEGLQHGVQALTGAGAVIVTGGARLRAEGSRFENTLLRVAARQFLEEPERLQREAFGNATLVIVATDHPELQQVIEVLEGNLTGSIYSSSTGEDDSTYTQIADALRFRVGRLLNDKMPTGVALSPAMNHGGPFPSTSHPGFTAVGIPRSMARFGALHCYDNLRQDRLPLDLRDKAPSERVWRMVDGEMVRG